MSLQATALTIRYGARLAVDAVTLDARPGEVLTILGANGSGKSSLLRALAGLQRHEGQVICTARGIGYLPQDCHASAALTVFEVVLLGRLRSLTFRVGPADLDAARAALEELGITGLAGQRIGTLSGGQRQLAFIAQVLAGAPGLLLLDEPTSALDIAHQVQVLDHVRAVTRRRNLVTIAVLHDLNAAARFAGRVALMHAGRLIAHGPPAEVLSPAAVAQTYGVPVSVMTGPDGHPVVVPHYGGPLPAASQLDPQLERTLP